MGLSLLLLVSCVLTVAYGQITIEPEDIEGHEGENVTITCIVGSTEPSSTQLLTDNNQILVTLDQDIQDDRVVYTYGPLVRENDDGRVVTCRFGSLTATGFISVLFPPLYSLETAAERDLVEGTASTILFTVFGNPLPTLEETTWRFSGPAGTELGSGVILDIDSLTFDSVSREHTGVYSVSSTTSAGSSNVLNITINVLYPPTFVEPLSPDVACDLLDGSTQYTCATRPGDSGTLNCAAVGNPEPSLAITETSANIASDSATGEVTVGPVTTDDNGAIVECNATNTQDSVLRSFIIYVGSGPAEPSDVTAMVQDNLVVISWSWSDPNNNVPLSQFLLTVTKEGESRPLLSETPPPTDRSLSIELSQLEASTLYNIVVIAENLVESSNPIGAQVTTPAAIDGGPGGSAAIATSCLLSVLLMASITLLL